VIGVGYYGGEATGATQQNSRRREGVHAFPFIANSFCFAYVQYISHGEMKLTIADWPLAVQIFQFAKDLNELYSNDQTMLNAVIAPGRLSFLPSVGKYKIKGADKVKMD